MAPKCLCEYSLKTGCFPLKTVFEPNLQPHVVNYKKYWGIGVSYPRRITLFWFFVHLLQKYNRFTYLPIYHKRKCHYVTPCPKRESQKKKLIKIS